MMEYVKIGDKVIQVHEKETDDLFKYLWEYDDVEGKGAETDDENNFGEVTHYFSDMKLYKGTL